MKWSTERTGDIQLQLAFTPNSPHLQTNCVQRYAYSADRIARSGKRILSFLLRPRHIESDQKQEHRVMRRLYILRQLALAAAILSSELFAVSIKTIPVGTTPIYLAVNQMTNRVYVSNLLSHTVSVIDGATNTVAATVPVGTDPSFIDVDANTNMVYVSNINSVSVIDGHNNTVVTTITDVSSHLALR
jgi:YVTN family beta-propeller protein